MTDDKAVLSRRAVRMKYPGERRSVSRSATRALDVLELFGLLRRPLRAVEIGAELGLHPSSTNQLLKTMLDSAHLTFDASSKTYLPSPRLAHFNAWMASAYGDGERLRRLIAEVQAQTGELITLSTPNDLFMQLVDFAGTPHEDHTTERGLGISIFGSILGAAYLSTLREFQVAKLADRARLKPEELSAILAALAPARAERIIDGASPGSSHWVIAAPLPSRAAPVPLVLGLSGPAQRVQPRLRELREHLLQAVASAMAIHQPEAAGI